MSKWEFAAGSITGLRGWNVDQQGRLVGVTYPSVWKPGENISICAQGTRGVFNALTPDDHHFKPECSCGFWAHNETHNFVDCRVFGAIEGYGKVLAGPQGFRAEKARIVALTFDTTVDWEGDEVPPVPAVVQSRVRALYPDVPYYETRAELIAAHPAPPEWASPTAEDFWDDPVARKAAELREKREASLPDNDGSGFTTTIPALRAGDTLTVQWPSGLVAKSTVFDPREGKPPVPKKRFWHKKKSA